MGAHVTQEAAGSGVSGLPHVVAGGGIRLVAPAAFTHRVPPDRRTRDKVAIVGFTDHRVLALKLDRAEWEIWGLNELHKMHDWRLFDRWFEVHARTDIDGDAEHVDGLAKMDIPVYMQSHHADIPAAVPFPAAAVTAAMGIDYYTSSIAWETAFAIMLGFREIHVYGVDMSTDTEYNEQRTCCEYWLGRANGAGIKTSVPVGSDLLKTVGQYGFGEVGTWFAVKCDERIAWLHRQDNEFLGNLRAIDGQYAAIKAKLEDEFETKMGQLEAEYKAKRDQLWEQRSHIFGAILNMNYVKQSLAIPGAASREFSPDRSKDPQVTGISAPTDSMTAAQRISAPPPRAPTRPPAEPDANGVAVKSRVATMTQAGP